MAGYTTNELEDRVATLALRLGVPMVEVSAAPTSVQVAVGPIARQEVHTLRVRPAPVDLGAISRLDDLLRNVFDGDLDAVGAQARLDELDAATTWQSWPIMLAGTGGVGLALTPLLGGDWRDALVGGLVGVLVGAIMLAGRRRRQFEPVVVPLAAMAASFAASALVELGLGTSRDVITLAALVPLIPGMTLTVGMTELASKDLQSGVANAAGALVQLLGVVFGVEVGRSIATAWLGASTPVLPVDATTAAQVLAALLAGLAFTATLRARARDAPLMCAATLLALTANAVGTELLGKKAGVFGAALAVGIAGGLISTRLRRSSLVFVVPGVLMLVPGSLGYASVLQLLTNDTVSGVTAAFDTFVTAVSIAYGLMIAALVVPAGVTKARARRAAAAASSRPG